MDKSAFNNPYQLLPQIFRGAETFVQKERSGDASLGVDDAKERHKAKIGNGDCNSSLANYNQIECLIELNGAHCVLRKAA